MPSITLTKAPFNFQRTRNNAVTVREPGEYVVGETIDQDVAEAAVARGHAEWLDAPAKPAKAKPKKATSRKKPAKPKADAADPGQPAGVDRTDLAPDDSADGGPPVADAG